MRSKCASNRDYTVSVQDLTDWENEYGAVPSGAVILVETGWSEKYSDMADYYGKKTTNQNPLFRSRDWLTANQGPVFPGPVGSW